jgi:hypothetical protein
MTELTAEQKEHFRNTIFRERPEELCEDCGGYHLRKACPRIKRIVTIGQGSGVGNRVEVEYWEHWDHSETIYPEEVWEDSDSAD